METDFVLIKDEEIESIPYDGINYVITIYLRSVINITSDFLVVSADIAEKVKRIAKKYESPYLYIQIGERKNYIAFPDPNRESDTSYKFIKFEVSKDQIPDLNKTIKFNQNQKQRMKDVLLVIENQQFQNETLLIGLKLTKKIYGDNPPDVLFKYVSREDYSNLGPIKFEEILAIKNLEIRRFVLKKCEDILPEILPSTKISEKEIKKSTSWIVDGKIENKHYVDRYEVHKVPKEDSGFQSDLYFVLCKDTSTDRMYRIWIPKNMDPVEAIAWTMQVDTPTENIDYIIRQGDLIMVKVRDPKMKCDKRHLTKEEYLNLIRFES